MCLKSPETRVWTLFCKNYCYENIRENSVVREYSDPVTLFTFYHVAVLWCAYLKSFKYIYTQSTIMTKQEQGPSPLIAQFGRAASSRKVCLFQTSAIYGEPSMQQFVLEPSPDLCLDTIQSLSSAGSSFSLMDWFLL